MFQIREEQQLASTNSYALELLQENRLSVPTVIVAKSQIKGRGQAKNQWFSEEGKSLTFSIVLFPECIRAERQFVLSQIVCLSIYDTLQEYTSGVEIKWPNDIYIRGVKCCGVLIESAVMGQGLAHSVCGVGLNVNNTSFSEGYTATSLRKETGVEFNLEILLKKILTSFEHYYKQAEAGEYAALNSCYHQYLHKAGIVANFEDAHGTFKATTIGVDQYGQLLLKDSEGQLRTYGFKEVAWLP